MKVNYENLLRTLNMATEKIDSQERAIDMYSRENSIYDRMLKLGLGEKTERNNNLCCSDGHSLKKEIYASIYEIEEMLRQCSKQFKEEAVSIDNTIGENND